MELTEENLEKIGKYLLSIIGTYSNNYFIFRTLFMENFYIFDDNEYTEIFLKLSDNFGFLSTTNTYDVEINEKRILVYLRKSKIKNIL